jgi:hypothetical protein
MNHLLECRMLRRPPAVALTALLLIATTVAHAAPGAHGPNGEHLDAPTAVGSTSVLPRVEAKSEAFELVATLYAGELSVLIDRFESNEPVLNAVLEVESGGVRSKATFHADQGDYAVDDPKLLAVLRAPGEHALVFTLAAGQDNDLLDATLVTSVAASGAAKDDHGHAHGDDAHGHGHEIERAAWTGAGIAVLGLIGGIAWWRQRRRNPTTLQGGL